LGNGTQPHPICPGVIPQGGLRKLLDASKRPLTLLLIFFGIVPLHVAQDGEKFLTPVKNLRISQKLINSI